MNSNHSIASERLGVTDAEVYGITYEVSIGIASFPFLGDHRIQGAAVVPGTAFLEMALASAMEVYGEKSCFLHDVEFHEALFLSEQGQRLVRLQISDAIDHDMGFRIVSIPEGLDFSAEEFTVHVTGSMRLARREPGSATADVNPLGTMLSSCTKFLSGKDHVEALNEKGFGFGPAFRQVKRMWCGERMSLGEVVLPRSLLEELDSYYFHPALLDACLQVCAGALPEELHDHAYLPVGAESFRLHRSPPDRLWSHVLLRETDVTAAKSLHADIRVLDDAGNLIAEISGLKIQRFDRVAPCAVREGIEDYFYDLDWVTLSKPSLLDMTAIEGQQNPRWVLFGASGEIGLRLSAELEKRGLSCVLVAPGDSYARIGDSHYQLWPGNKQHYERLLDDLELSPSDQCKMLYLSDFSEADDAAADPAHVVRSTTDRCFSLLALVQTLISRTSVQNIRLWLLTKGGCCVKESDRMNPVDAALAGLSRVIAQEHPQLWGGVLDLDENECNGDEKILIDELLQPASEVGVAFRSGTRFVQRLIRDSGTHGQKPEFRARADRTYLITGGLGGVGLEIASWLVKQGARHLALSGRTPMPERSAWSELPDSSNELRRATAVLALEKLGATVYLPAADVGNRRQMQLMFASLANEAPPICGILHAAGSVLDRPLVELDYPSLASVMDAKVAGAWLLHEHSLELDLDFFVLFSSLSAILGAPGQGNYAAANAFLDALAVYRRQCGVPSLSINWGPWDATGMTARMDKTIFTRLGLQPLKNEQGCQSLGMLLGRGETASRKIVAGFDWARFRNSELAPVLGRFLENIPVAKGDGDDVETGMSAVVDIHSEPIGAAPTQPPAIHGLDDITAYLKTQVSTVLGLDGSQSIDPNEPLMNYGFESLMAVRLRNMLENDLKQAFPTTLVFDYPTLGDLAAYIDSKMDGQEDAQVQEPIDDGSHAAILEMLEEVERMTDDRAASGPV